MFATLTMSVSFKVTELLRFPNAVHTACWYPWILYAMTAIAQSKSWRMALGHGIGMFVAIIGLFTGGYPYFLWYAPFLLCPYAALLLLYGGRRKCVTHAAIGWKRVLVVYSLAVGSVLLVCAPYLAKFWDLMQQTTDRAGQSFAYSTEHVFSCQDSIGSLLFPPAAQTEGWYYFGSVPLFLIMVHVFTLVRRKLTARRAMPKNIENTTSCRMSPRAIASMTDVGNKCTKMSQADC